jgi:uncharacterized membrane protein YbhN (UPF0104 family)
MLKKILNSRLLKVLISAVLIYFAFRKVNVTSLLHQLVGIKIWFVVVNILLSFILVIIISFRWSLLLIKRPKWKDILIFTKSSFAAAFYGLFFPTSVAGDLLKWIIIDEKYPKISKTKLLGSVILDRFIGLSMFMLIGFIMILIASSQGTQLPLFIILMFAGLLGGCLIFYIAIIFFDVHRLFQWKWFKRFENIGELIKKDNLGQIAKAVLTSVLSEGFWIIQMWFISWYFGANLSVLSIFIFMPIISIILILPISIAGFGAREQLFLFFFSGIASSNESILLTSTFAGILGVMNSLFGGLVTLTPDFKKIKK